jgi:pyruvate dehydrogenase E2 component (dihydrolipoamide acetyltransferase)
MRAFLLVAACALVPFVSACQDAAASNSERDTHMGEGAMMAPLPPPLPGAAKSAAPQAPAAPAPAAAAPSAAPSASGASSASGHARAPAASGKAKHP